MTHVKIAALALVSTLILLPVPALAGGNHFGWCIGVGNKHASDQCGGGSDPDVGATPSTVPTSNQLPDPATINLYPDPPQTFEGTGQVQPIQGQPGGSFTGTGQLPIIVAPNPQQVFTGTGPTPPVQGQPGGSFTGTEQLPIIVTPNPQQTFTGTGPLPPVQGQPGGSFTGQGQMNIIVSPLPPTTVTGVGPVTAGIVIDRPGQVVTGFGRVPQPTAYPTPNAVPQAIPTPLQQATPMLVPRPKPVAGATTGTGTTIGTATGTGIGTNTATGGGAIVHVPNSTGPAKAKQHITRLPGRQPVHAEPRFAADDGGKPWRCLASGHGKRLNRADEGFESAGALRHVGAVDVLGRDLPALHPRHPNCIISIRRRRD